MNTLALTLAAFVVGMWGGLRTGTKSPDEPLASPADRLEPDGEWAFSLRTILGTLNFQAARLGAKRLLLVTKVPERGSPEAAEPLMALEEGEVRQWADLLAAWARGQNWEPPAERVVLLQAKAIVARVMRKLGGANG